jgi:diacylglycerol kinase (ATP)
MVVLANPNSGRGLSGPTLDAAVPVLAQGARVEVIVAEDPAAATAKLAASLDRVDPRNTRLVAVGGDGTVHLALQQALAHAVPLAIIPCGSGNDAARSVGLPDDPVAAAKIALNGVPLAADVGHVRSPNGTSAHFLSVLSCGFDSVVSERANRLNWPHGRARYLRAVATELPGFRPVRFVARFDGVEHAAPAMLVCVGNSPYYGGGMKICPDADIHDGKLDITWLNSVGKVEFVRAFPRVFAGTHLSHPAVSAFRAQLVELDAPGQVAYIDGERFGELPLTIRVLPGALQLVVP